MSVTALRRIKPEVAVDDDSLHHLMAVLPAGVVIIDGHGRVAEANPVAVDLLAEPLKGALWRDVIARAFRPRADDGHEVSLHDGRRIRIETRALAPRPGQLVMLTDLTETRALQGQISHLQRLSALGKMVATLAHQVRTPLSAAMLYAANLASDKLDGLSRQRFADKLLARLRDLEHQVNDMLLFARAGQSGELEPISLPAMMAEVSDACAGFLASTGATLWVSDVPASQLMGNSRALSGAIQNLIHNAAQAGGRGVAIRVDITDVSSGIELRIADNGPGIPESLRTRIFEPFFTTRAQGTGLGLAVVQAVVRQHQGQISLESATGHGTTFTMRLPRLTVAPSAGELS